jgi:putative secretion ATPase (PEP-CTERM system associated)
MYESFYRLKAKPFQLNPDPTFFYGSRGHKRAMAYLQYGLYQGEGFIVITGDVGAGKTTLVRSLLQQLDNTKFVAAQLVSTQLDADDILRSVAHAFGLSPRGVDKAQILADIEQFLRGLGRERKRALLIVDEAQNLAPRAIEELRMLSNYQGSGVAQLQSFLIGQPELRELMRSPSMLQLRQRVIASYHLGPIDRAETEEYIKHRLGHVGWEGDPSFDAAAFDAIHVFTGGVPRKINTLCNRLLLAGYLGETHTLSARDVDAVTAEIKEELGDEHSTLYRLRAAAALIQGGEESGPEDASRSTGMTAHTATGDDMADRSGSHDFAASSLEGRVASLEKAMLATLGVLQRLVESSKGERASAQTEA